MIIIFSISLNLYLANISILWLDAFAIFVLKINTLSRDVEEVDLEQQRRILGKEVWELVMQKALSSLFPAEISGLFTYFANVERCALFLGNFSTFLFWHILALLAGNILALLTGLLAAFLLGDFLALLTGNLLAFLLGNVLAALSGHLSALLPRI